MNFIGGGSLLNRIVITGNEAVSRGFWEAGGAIASSYPGSPTVSILDSMKSYSEIFAQWGSNEKVAMEIAIGGSMAGARSLVSMKHVGINIASDPFMTFTQTKIKGGFLLVVGDDPGLSSSQNEQDSRFWGKYANIPVLDPSTPQEVKDYIKEGLKISEDFNTPVLIRLTSHLCHSRGIVEVEERVSSDISGFQEEQGRYSMLPPYAVAAQEFMYNRMTKLREYNNENSLNKLEKVGSEVLVITSSLCYENLKEINAPIDILKLGMVWPMPAEYIRDLSQNYSRIIVVEETLGFMEEELKIQGIPAEGKKYFSYTGEMTIEEIKKGLGLAGIIEYNHEPNEEYTKVPRTPMLCSGCPHRPVFHILKKLKSTVIGDIGCYSLGILEPFEVHKTNISMGASLGMALGVAKGQSLSGNKKPIVATIGDGTFFHSGMTGFMQLAECDENITVIVMDNRTTAMTGGQITPTTSKYFTEYENHGVNISDVLTSFGVKDITTVDQFKYKDTKEAISSAMKRAGLSVIITTRPCALNFKIKKPHFYVDENICISCRSCIQTNCPPISMKQYEGKTKKNSYIDPDMCVGCSVCSQICPVGAIKRSSPEEV